MEKQLELLGKRWAQICHWMEEQWLLLQELLMRWQQFSDEQAKFNDWLTEKEGILQQMKSADLNTVEQVISQVRYLKVSVSVWENMIGLLWDLFGEVE